MPQAIQTAAVISFSNVQAEHVYFDGREESDEAAAELLAQELVPEVDEPLPPRGVPQTMHSMELARFSPYPHCEQAHDDDGNDDENDDEDDGRDLDSKGIDALPPAEKVG